MMTIYCWNKNFLKILVSVFYKRPKTSKSLLLSAPRRNLKTSIALMANQSGKKTALLHESYFHQKDKTKETFLKMIDQYKIKEKNLRGHVEFIQAALKYLEEFGVHRDLEVYKKLLDIMPKGRMIPTNIVQQMFLHYPKHQYCAIDVLEKMESHGVQPDSEVELILINTFGKYAIPTMKYARMMYWMPKFKNACPWPLPEFLPEDALELAKMALTQINSVDPSSNITVMQTSDIEDSIDDTWIVSSISPLQKELISQHVKKKPIKPVKVEGPFGVFLRDQRISYFILRANPKPQPPVMKRSELDDVSNLFLWMRPGRETHRTELMSKRSVHEQNDGVILASCATGSSSRDSLLSWIRLLEKSVPDLSDIPILFTQSSPVGDIILATNEVSSSTPTPAVETSPEDTR